MDKIMGFLPFMLECTVVTVEIFVLTLVISLPLGLPVALGSNSRIKPLSILCKTYVWIFRGTPLLLQLFFFYYFFPLVNSIDIGQYEAAHSLGLSRRQTMMDIIMPQTMKAILPPVVNEAITLVKDTALASTLPIIDLMKATNSAVNRTSDVTPYFFAAVIYLLMTFVLSLLARRLEKYFKRYDGKGEL